MAEDEAKTEETETVADDAAVADSVETTTETAEETKAPEPSEAEKKLTEQINELQGKYDSIAQDGAKNKQLLEEITPYVNWDGMKAGRAGGDLTDEGAEEDEQTFLTQKEAKALEERIDRKIKTGDFQRDFRTKFPDLGDKGPKEEMVRYFFENKTLRTDNFDKRLESAVKATRILLKSEQDKGAAKTKADEDKAAAEEKTKAEAAAKASGLSSAGITSPKTPEKEETGSAEDYVASRKARLEKLRTL